MSEQPPSQPDQPVPPGGTPQPGPYPQQGQPAPGAYGAPPPPYQQGPQGYPAYQPPGDYQRPQKKRPRALWFFVGGLLLVAGIAIGVALFVTAVTGAIEEDGVITANAQPASIDAKPGAKRMLFVPSGERAPSCTLVDGTGKQLLLRPIFTDATLSTGGTDWKGFAQVDSTGDGKVTITCTPTGSGDGTQVQVRMGAPIDLSSLGGRVVAGLAALLLLGGTGFVILLVTTILWFTRKPVQQG